MLYSVGMYHFTMFFFGVLQWCSAP